MRLALSFILSFFFFAAPPQVSAGDIHGRHLALAHQDVTTGIELVDCFTIDNNAEAITPLNQVSTSISQGRFQCHPDFINNVTVTSRIKFFYKTSDRIQTYLPFKSMGLKLIFPEHYFW